MKLEKQDCAITSLSSLVNRTLIEIPRLLLVLSDRLDVHDRHAGVELFQVALSDGTRRNVPSRPLHEEAVCVRSLGLVGLHLSSLLLGHLAREAHLVQRQLVLPRGALHDRRQERLGVEEAWEPNRRGKVEVGSPSFQFLWQKFRVVKTLKSSGAQSMITLIRRRRSAYQAERPLREAYASLVQEGGTFF